MIVSGRLRRFARALGMGLGLAVGIAGLSGNSPIVGQEPSAGTNAATAAPVPLNRQGTVLLDKAGGKLILKTEVVLRDGLLEMFLCKAHTKEHESILSIDADAWVIHGGLIALGAETGTPVRYEPKFQAPTGTKIDVFVRWRDAEGKERRVNGKTWVRHTIHRYYEAPVDPLPAGIEVPRGELRYDPNRKQLIWFGPMTQEQRDELLRLSQQTDYRQAVEGFYSRSQSKELEADWVFAGSGFYTMEDGTRYYQAEGGDVICVANFADAMIDLAAESTSSGEGLLFEPYTERVPPLGTKVEVELTPVLKKGPAAASDEKPAASDRPAPRP